MNIKIEYKANNTRDRFAYPEHQRPFPPSLNIAVCLQSMAAPASSCRDGGGVFSAPRADEDNSLSFPTQTELSLHRSRMKISKKSIHFVSEINIKQLQSVQSKF